MKSGFHPRTALLLAMLCLPLQALAEVYRVDLIVFLDKNDATELGRTPAPVDLGKVVELDNAAALKAAGITVLPDDQFGLTDQWQRLKTAKRYQPLIKLAWLQKDPPADRGNATLRLKWGEGLSLSNGEGRGASLAQPVDGTVALLLNTYLNLEVDLTYTQREADGTGGAWRLKQKRKMKRDELHHLDSAKLGVLAKITKATP